MKNRMEPNEITTVCCMCGKHISGPWPAAPQNLSHSYCQQHYQAAMQEIQAYRAMLDRQYGLAPRALAA